MQVQITSDCLTLEQFYEVVVDGAKVSVDAVLLQKLQIGKDARKFVSVENRHQAAAALQLLLNTPEIATLEQITKLIAQLNGEEAIQFGAPEADQVIDQTVKASGEDLFNYVCANAAQPAAWLATSLWLELSCVPGGAFFQDYVNQYLNTHVKTTAQAVRQLCANSKKVNTKAFSELTTGTLASTARLHEVLTAFRPALRMLLKSSIETHLHYNHSASKVLPLELKVQVLLAQLRLELIQKNFSAQEKGWKGLNAELVIEKKPLKDFYELLKRFWGAENEQKPSNQAYEAFLDESSAIFADTFGTKSHTELLFSALKQEISHYVGILSKFERLQIGQELILLLPELKKLSEENFSMQTLSNIVNSHLKTAEASRRKPQPARGARDYTPYQLYYREKYIETFKKIFIQHGLVQIDTPVFELRSVLMDKYGEDEKLIYELQDTGEEQLALRYDLTVPFARYCVGHGIERFRKFAMGKVYRRDKPYVSQGRFREFMQIDVDLVGHEGAINDAEVLWILADCLKVFKMPFKYHISHRGVLNALLDHCGVVSEKIKAACSVIDQLDKSSIDEVKQKLVEQKGIPADVTEKIAQLIQLTCSAAQFDSFLEDLKTSHTQFYQKAEKPLQELESIIHKLNICAPHLQDCFCIDLSLARGLDYYTGVIFEARLEAKDKVIAVSGGGRFDGLFASINPEAAAPVVGGSIGLDRLLALTFEHDDLVSEAQAASQEPSKEKGGKKEKKQPKQPQNQDLEVEQPFDINEVDEQTEGTHNFQQNFHKKKLDVMICAAPGYNSEIGIDVYAKLINAGFSVGCTFREHGSQNTLKTDMDRGFQSRCSAFIYIGGTEAAEKKCNIMLVSDRKTEHIISNDEVAAWLLDRIGADNPTLYKQYVQLQVKKLEEGTITQQEFCKLLK